VVIHDVEDLHLRPTCELPVSDVALPPLVGHVRFEPDERTPRSFLGLGTNEAPPGEDPPDRGGSRSLTVASLEMEADGVGAGIEALIPQHLAETHDVVFK
jgi:hypothetical protein